MPGQPLPKMQVQLDVSQVRSQRKTCSSSAGSWNSIQARGKTRSTSGTAPAYAAPVVRARRPGSLIPCASVCSTSAPTRATCSWSTPTVARRRCRRPPYKEAAAAGRAPRRRTARSPSKGIDALTEFVGHALDARRGQGLRGDLLLRHLGGARRRQLRRGARPRREAHRRRDQGAARRGRGPADLPRRTPLVRLVVGPARRLRHRRRLARDRRRRRRVARRGLVAAARRRTADPRALRRRAARATRRCASCASRSAPTIAHDAGTLLRGGAPDHAVATSKTFRSLARICGAAPSSEGLFVRRILPAAELDEWIPKLLEMDARRHRRPAGRLQRPRPPGGRGRPGGRRGDGRLRPRASSRSARGRCARASSSTASTSSARGADGTSWPPMFALSTRLGLSRDHHPRLRLRRPARLRRRRGDGRHRLVSQSIEKVRALRDYHQVPVCAVHAPCLLITQRVWGTDPWVKLERSAEMAAGPRRRRGRRAPAVPLAARLRRAASSRGSPTSSVVRASRSRSRTCIRGGPPRAAR